MRVAFAALCLLMATLFGGVFYERYWRHRACFNELGRCWDSASEQVFVDGAGWVWGTPAALLLLVALLLRPWRR